MGYVEPTGDGRLQSPWLCCCVLQLLVWCFVWERRMLRIFIVPICALVSFGFRSDLSHRYDGLPRLLQLLRTVSDADQGPV